MTESVNNVGAFSIVSVVCRIGYGAFPKSMLEILWRAKQPYNVTTASQVAAVAAMQNLEYVQVRSNERVGASSLLLRDKRETASPFFASAERPGQACC